MTPKSNQTPSGLPFPSEAQHIRAWDMRQIQRRGLPIPSDSPGCPCPMPQGLDPAMSLVWATHSGAMSGMATSTQISKDVFAHWNYKLGPQTRRARGTGQRALKSHRAQAESCCRGKATGEQLQGCPTKPWGENCHPSGTRRQSIKPETIILES